jgi:surfeit locus 1 family protein
MSLSTLIRSWRWPWVMFTLLVFLGLIKLGFWQVSRAIEKEQRLTRIDSLTSLAPMSLSEINEFNQNTNDLPVALSGTLNNQYKFLLDNQTNNGQLGYRVLQVFTDHDKQQHVLVNLGWVLGSVDRKKTPQLHDVDQYLNINGHVRKIEKGIVLAQQNYQQVRWPFRIQQIEIDKISQLINIELLPFVVFLDKTETIGYEKNWQPIVMRPEKHRGYALQWFTLSVAWLSLMLWASYKSCKQELPS